MITEASAIFPVTPKLVGMRVSFRAIEPRRCDPIGRITRAPQQIISRLTSRARPV